jgi:hypothetical protein
VSRRVRVPAADELFRTTGAAETAAETAAVAGAVAGAVAETGPAARDRLRAVPDPGDGLSGHPGPASPAGDARRSTGRTRHPEKITVYISAPELLELERARLTLRAEWGLAVDRGRLVREAVAAVLEEFDAAGEASTLVQRLRRS